VEVRPYVDAEEFWGTFERWGEEEAEEILRNARSLREEI
jgi:hypothetical protein